MYVPIFSLELQVQAILEIETLCGIKSGKFVKKFRDPNRLWLLNMFLKAFIKE
jgi:hypothetical protein